MKTKFSTFITELKVRNSHWAAYVEKAHQTLNKLTRFDGEIKLGQKTGNQCDKVAEEGGSTLYYCSVNPPLGDIECYLIVDKKGKHSYYGTMQTNDKKVMHRVLALDDKLITQSAPKQLQDRVDRWVEKYKIESGKGKSGCIAAYYELLKSFHDGEGPAPEKVDESVKPGPHEYETSADFTNDMIEVSHLVHSIGTIIKSPKFKNWAKATDHNYSTSCKETLDETIGFFDKLDRAYQDFLEQIDKADHS